MAVSVTGGPLTEADLAQAREGKQVRRNLPTWPRLREDIRLLQGAPTREGAPSWTLYDPALHRYLRIGRLEFEILCRWDLGDPERIARAIAAETTLTPGTDDVMDMLRFAWRAKLVNPAGQGAALAHEVAARKLSPAMWLLKNYLFVRVRLVDPDRALGILYGLVRWAYTPGFLAILAIMGLAGIYLVGRQWDAYLHSFPHLFTLQGAFFVGVALAFAKFIHEVGHGLMAKRFGCRVPGMGIALLVLWPLPWTDVTDAWRLTNRHQRILIDAAGVLAEMALAIIATLAWSILDDGPARTAAFLLSSSAWLITLAINVNPLMRFDGYFLLSDMLDEPNLQDRSFALARWQLREILFGLGDPVPERLPARRHWLMVAYAVGCWAYRFTVFLGIAVLVYHLTFKLLGLFLMAVEIGWFIIRPITNELTVWGQRISKTQPRARIFVFAAIVVAGIVALALPWRGTVTAPALIHATQQSEILSTEAGVLIRATPRGAVVREGDVLFALQSPDIDYAQRAALAEITALRARLTGQAFDPDAAQDISLVWQQLEGSMAKLRDAEARSARLEIRAAFAGTLLDAPRDLAPGTWLPRREFLGRLVDPSQRIVEALVAETDIGRVRHGAAARFLPENGEAPLDLTISDIGEGAVARLDQPEFASQHGGGVATRIGEDRTLRPESAVYRVRFAITGDTPGEAAIRRGMVEIEGERASILGRIWRRAVSIVLRELNL